ncbi:hypothetical protein ACOMHN_046864 [Nucella lapillus]
MALKSTWIVMALAIAIDLSLLPGTEAKPNTGPVTAMPYPILLTKPTPPVYCTCEVRCCKTVLEKRRSISAGAPFGASPLNSPLVRHKRCCGCHPCNFLQSHLSTS